MAPLPQARPYRDFYTPVLHKRFADVCFYTLLLCFAISVWMGEFNSYFWAWFPIGPAGLRTLLLLIPSLFVYLIRVSYWHVGQRNTDTPWHTLRKHAFRASTLTIFVGYALSAFLYGEIYMWSRPSTTRLGFTDTGRDYERIKLNERPYYLRSMFFFLAIAQSGKHIWCDYDVIETSILKPRSERDTTEAKEPVASPRQAIIASLKPAVVDAFLWSGGTTVGGTILYFAITRHLFWKHYYYLASFVVSLSRTKQHPTGLPPFFSLLIMFFVQGSLLWLLWQFCNRAFSIYISQAPLKRDKPITSESKDPNGSLLNGLKSPKDTIHAVALWELALITDRFPERRKTIYGELERKKAPTFEQVTSVCLAEVRLLLDRIGIALDPGHHSKTIAAPVDPTSVSLVPRIAPDLKDGAIKGPSQAPTTRIEKFGALTAGLAKSHSSPHNAQNAYAREYLRKGQEKLTQGAKEAEVYSSTWFAHIMSSSLGWPFRHNVRRSAAIVVTGAPYSRLSPLCNAITTLTNLTAFSIMEDDFGRFQNLVPDITRAFASAIARLDEYVATLNVPEGETLPESETVRECLREGLERIFRTFGEFLIGLGMSSAEVREAKKLAANGPEMAVVR